MEHFKNLIIILLLLLTSCSYKEENIGEKNVGVNNEKISVGIQNGPPNTQNGVR